MSKVPTNLRPGDKPIPKLTREVLPLWVSSGVREKPDDCQLCPYRLSGSGFVPDWFPDTDGTPPRLGFLLSHPSSDEVLEQRPWSGRAGYAWEKSYLTPFDLTRNDVYIGHVIRCQPRERRYGKPVYPTGKLRRDAELSCRRYDNRCWSGSYLTAGGLHALNPELFVVTFHPSDALATPALSRLILNDVGRAVKKMREGRRVLVLMGDEPKELIAPWLKGAVKTWRGTFWEGTYPFLENSALVEPGFIEA